jgi:hypothetical protein
MGFLAPDQTSPGGLAPQTDQPLPIHIDQNFFSDTLPAADQLFDPYRAAAGAIAPNILNPATPYARPDDPTFDPFAHIQGYEQTPQAFVGARNIEDVTRTKAQIDADRQAQDVMANSGAKGIVAALSIGALDPLNLIPLGAGAKLAEGGRILDSLYAGARVGFVTSAAQEAMLQAGHPERTADDALFSIAAGTVLMGAMGGAGHVLADLSREGGGLKSVFARTSEAVDRDLTIPVGRDPLAPGFAEQSAADLARDTGSVGAAAVRDTNLAQETLKGAYGVENFAKIISPLVKTVTSPSLAVRQIAQDLAETPLRFAKNTEGIASPSAVETLTKLWDSNLYQAQSGVDRAFLEYRGRAEQVLGNLRAATSDLLRREPGRLDRPAFNEAVGYAMRRGDAHPVAQVAAAAKHVRSTLIDPLKEAAIKNGMLDQGAVDEIGKTAQSYFTRVYNRQKIIARRPEFEDILLNGLKRSQAGATARMEEHAAAALEHAPNVQKFGQQVAEAKTAQAELQPIATAAKEARISRKRDVVAARSALGDAKKELTTAGKEVEAARKVSMRGDFDKPDAAVKRAVDREIKAEERVKAAEKDVTDKEAAFKDAKDTRAAAREKLARLGEDEFQATKNLRLATVMHDTAAAKAEEERAFAAATEEDLKDIGRQITDHILGMAPGRMQFAPVALSRGPVKERTLNFVKDTEIENFLESDVEHIARVYKRTMAPDVELTNKFGRADMQTQIEQIREDYAVKRNGITDERVLKKLDARMRNDIRDIEAMRDRLRGTYGMPDNPAGIAYRAARVVKDLNVLRLMGGSTLSSLPDMGRAVMVHGLTRVVGDGIVPMLKNWQAFNLSVNEAKLAGAALDNVLHYRSMGLADVFDDYGRLTKFERGLSAITSKFGMFSLLDPWTAFGKQFASVITQTRMLQAITQGGSAKELERLAMLGIGPDEARGIAAQFAAHGEEHDGILWANTGKWTDGDAVQTYRAALIKEVDSTIVQPGIGDRPLWMSTTLGGVLGQFRSFSMASTQRVALAGLQQHDAAFLNGTMLSIGLGMLSYKIQSQLAGRETAGVDSPVGVSRWIGEGVDRSGIIGSMSDVMAIGARTFGVGWSGSRYSGRGDVDLFLGPSSGLIRDAFTVTAAMRDGRLSEGEMKAARRLVPFQNLFYTRWLFDQAEKGLSTGLPQ